MAAGAIGTAYVDVKLDDSQVNREVDGVGGKMRGSLGKLGRAGGLALGAGLAAGFVGAKKLSDAAADLDESVNKTRQTFEGASGSMLTWSKDSATAMGLSQQAALEGASSIGAMLKPMGVAPKTAAVMSKSMTQLAADMASFNNEDPTEMLDRIRAGLSGESEPLKRYGAVLSEARVAQFAYTQGIAETGAKLTETQKIQARYGLLLKDTADQQGDFERTSGGLANQQRILRAELDNAAATLGQALLPAVTAIVSGLAGAVPHVVAFGQAFIARVTPAVHSTVEAVVAAWPTVQRIIVGVVDIVRGALSLFAGDASSTSSSVSGSVSDVRRVFEVVFNAIAAVVSFGAATYQKVATAIRAHSAEIRATMQALRAIFDAVWPAIARVVEVAWGIMRTMIETSLKVIGNIIRAVMAAIRGDWDQVWSSLRAAAGAAISGAASIVRQVLTGLGPAVLSLALNVGSKIVAGILNGLASLAGKLAGALAAIPRALIAAAAGVAGTAAGIGRDIVSGILSGLGGLFGMLKSKLESTLRGALSSLNPFSSVAHGGEIHIGRPIAEGAIRGWVLASAELPAKIEAGVQNAVERGRTAVEAARGRLGAAWGQLGDDLLTAFDAAWSKPTKAEAQLEKLRAQAESGRLTQAISDARAQLETAQTPDDEGLVDAAKVAAAQRALDDALLAQRMANLQRIAEAERRERDAAVALKRRHFEEDLAELQARVQREGLTRAQATAAVTSLLKRYRISYKNVAGELGTAFVTGLKESLADAVSVAQQAARDIERALAGVRTAASKSGGKPSGAGPSGAVSPGMPAGPLTAGAPLGLGGDSGGLVGPLSPTRMLAGTLSRALAGFEPSSSTPSLDGLEVSVYIGDEPLRGIVRHEVSSHDAGIVRTLTAGAV